MSRNDRAVRVGLVVPCFDEESRLSPDRLAEMATDPAVRMVLVDDGSRDATLDLLHTIAAEHESAEVLALGRNLGKGEAVRLGLNRAIELGSEWVGYVDADLSTPPAEVVRLMSIATSRDDLDVVLGTRVAILGRTIERSAWRHYSGRVFATAASIVLGKPVYDTQCGAKLLRVTDALRHSLERPFRSRWAFDVEILGRLDREGVPAAAFWEEPLSEWRDVDASKRDLRASIRATADLWAIRRDLERWRPR